MLSVYIAISKCKNHRCHSVLTQWYSVLTHDTPRSPIGNPCSPMLLRAHPWHSVLTHGTAVPGRGGFEYLGEGGWSTGERGVGVPGRGGLEYLGEGVWSTWERASNYVASTCNILINLISNTSGTINDTSNYVKSTSNI